ncbi:MAG: CBS domain-containing protein [Alphaproteobacteria bacterium]|nr:CBS domain-containing protein [Alphaproteobacteria bacterium]
MKASDIMTAAVVSVAPADTVQHAAELMVKHRVSALPVVETNGKLVGMVSEGDLLHREETHTEKKRSWWLEFVTGYETRAKEYVKAFGLHVRDVMTPGAVTVVESASLSEIAEILETKHIKRVPVMRGSSVVGIVSRANLVQAIASLPRLVVPDSTPDDAAIRARVMAELRKQRWAPGSTANVVVHNGVVHLWGTVFTAGERSAIHVLVERIAGVRGLQDHMVYYVPPAILV